MNNQDRKVFLIVLIIATVIITLISGTLAYFNWQTTEAQKTRTTFTIASDYSCSADGGGNITNNDANIVPAACTNSTHAIKREVKVNVQKNGTSNIYLDMYLNVNSIGTGLANSQNFKYALTTSSTSCEDGVIKEGNFSGATTGTHKILFNPRRYTSTTSNDTYYLWIWLDAAETNASTQNQPFNLSLEGSCSDQEPPAIYAPWGEEVDRFSQVNFNQTSIQNGTNGLYLFQPTAEDTHPVYYYRGNVNNNNVLFANFCWKIVRTTDTGGTKLIYNGTPTSGSCVNTTGTATQLDTTSQFNSANTSPADVGYMYGTRYISMQKGNISSISDSYLYGESFTYSNGNYTLVNTKSFSGTTWSTNYNTLNYNHYTCFNTTGTCSTLYYIYRTNDKTIYFINLKDGKDVSDAFSEMFINSNDSAIKIAIDNWYSSNMTSYTSYLENTIWCNDRSIYDMGGWDSNGGDTTKELVFGAFQRANIYKPSLSCVKNDAFTLPGNTNGNSKLSYPVGLLTGDEIMLAGGKFGAYDNKFYLYTNQAWWLLASYKFGTYVSTVSIITNVGYFKDYNLNNSLGVRPSVSLKPGVTFSGEGTIDEPYTVSLS